MRKRRTGLFILVFALFTAAVMAVVGFSRYREMSDWSASIERRVAPDGTVYELISIGGNRLCLRMITSAGLVTGYYVLPEAESRGMFAAYHMVGLIDGEVYLYRYDGSGNIPVRKGEAIVAYNMADGKSRVVAEIPSPGSLDNYDVFYAPDAAQGGVFLGYLEQESGFLTVKRIDTLSGEVSEPFASVIDFPLASIAVSQSGELFALSRDSRVYLSDGGTWINVFQPESGERAGNMTAGADGLVYVFLVSDYSSGVAVSTGDDMQFMPFDLDTTGMTKLHVSDAANWVALDENFRYIVNTNGERRLINELTVPFLLLWNGESLFLLITSVFAAFAVFAAVSEVWRRRKLRLLPKLLLIIVPIFMLGMFILVSVAETFVTEITEEGLRYSILEYAFDAMKDIDAKKFAGVDWDNPFQDEYFTELSSYIGMLSEYYLVNMTDGSEEITHNAYASHWVYRVEGDKVYTAIGGHYVVGLEMRFFEYALGNTARGVMISEKKPVYDYQGGLDSNIQWGVVIYPFYDGDELVGFLEVARPLTAIDNAVYGVTVEIIKAGLLVFAAVITALVFVLALSTRTLGKLKRGALAVSGGDYTARVSVHSWDETGEIAAAFNKMAESVERSVNDITEVSWGYSRFVPDKLIELLGKDSIKEVNPGDHTSLTATHILLYTDSFDTLRDKAFFDALGRFYDAVIPCVASGGGLISHYSARGFTAMFEREPEAVLNSLIKVYEALDRLGGIDCHVFMSYSGAMLGVTGNGGNLNLITVSRLVYESFAVGAAGKRFGTRLIVSEGSYLEMGEAAARYRHRFLGLLTVDGETLKLYDFYDCDTIDMKIKKDETRAMFESGVRMYYAKEYYKARRVFVDIIKDFPEDMAAREYLRRSHAGYEAGGEPMPLLALK